MANDFNHKQYALNYEQYLKSNSEGKIGGGTPENRIKLLKEYLPMGRTVFEIGSAGGDEALLLKSAGFNVIATDYVEEFVKILKEKGLTASQFDAKTDNIPQPIDCIYANAVFVHFSPEETVSFLKRAKKQLANEKLVFLTVIKGEGNERSARNRGFERDFYYYSSSILKNLVESCGYRILYLQDEDPKWIQVILTSS